MVKLPAETSKRIAREITTLNAMLALYCKHHHQPGTSELCQDCQSLFDYAVARLHRCPFQDTKPTCGKCLIHCYNRDMQLKIRKVMRFSGPRLLMVHPVLALYHICDGMVKPQLHPKKKS